MRVFPAPNFHVDISSFFVELWRIVVEFAQTLHEKVPHRMSNSTAFSCRIEIFFHMGTHA